MEKKRLSDYRALARMTMKGHYGTMLLAVVVYFAIQMIISRIFAGLVNTQSSIMLAAYFVLELMVSIIILGPLAIGLNGFFLNCISGDYDIKNIFNPFRTNLGNTVKVYFFTQLKLFLWLIIPWLIGMVIVASAAAVIIINTGADWLGQIEQYLTQLLNMLEGVSANASAIPNEALGMFVALYSILLAVSLLFTIPGIIKAYEYMMIPYIVAEDADISVKEAFRRTKIMMKGNKLRYFGLTLSFTGWFLLGVSVLGMGVVLVIPYLNTANAHFYIDAKKRLGSSDTTEQEKDTGNGIDFDEGDTFGI